MSGRDGWVVVEVMIMIMMVVSCQLLDWRAKKSLRGYEDGAVLMMLMLMLMLMLM